MIFASRCATRPRSEDLGADPDARRGDGGAEEPCTARGASGNSSVAVPASRARLRRGSIRATNSDEGPTAKDRAGQIRPLQTTAASDPRQDVEVKWRRQCSSRPGRFPSRIPARVLPDGRLADTPANVRREGPQSPRLQGLGKSAQSVERTRDAARSASRRTEAERPYSPAPRNRPTGPHRHRSAKR